jgi:hypothetical protein
MHSRRSGGERGSSLKTRQVVPSAAVMFGQLTLKVFTQKGEGRPGEPRLRCRIALPPNCLTALLVPPSGRPRSVQEAAFYADAHRMGAIIRLQLGQNVFDPGFDCLLGDIQRFADRPVLLAIGDES